MTEYYRIIVYGPNSPIAGHRASDDLYEPHSGEFITFEGTREELMDVARSYDRLYDIGDFPWRVARTIAEELGEYLL